MLILLLGKGGRGLGAGLVVGTEDRGKIWPLGTASQLLVARGAIVPDEGRKEGQS